jgi:hypothetical protein
LPKQTLHPNPLQNQQIVYILSSLCYTKFRIRSLLTLTNLSFHASTHANFFSAHPQQNTFFSNTAKEFTMSNVNKWIRQIHRWLAMPFVIAIIILIAGSVQQGPDYVSPGWLGALGIGSILSLALTGLYMFGHHYLSKWRRAARSTRPAKAESLIK